MRWRRVPGRLRSQAFHRQYAGDVTPTLARTFFDQGTANDAAPAATTFAGAETLILVAEDAAGVVTTVTAVDDISSGGLLDAAAVVEAVPGADALAVLVMVASVRLVVSRSAVALSATDPTTVRLAASARPRVALRASEAAA